MGRNLYELDEQTKGRAIMQFHSTNAFRVGEDLIVLQADKKPVQFIIDENDNLSPTALNSDLAKDAFGHIITTSNQYNSRTYRLNKKEK